MTRTAQAHESKTESTTSNDTLGAKKTTARQTTITLPMSQYHPVAQAIIDSCNAVHDLDPKISAEQDNTRTGHLTPQGVQGYVSLVGLVDQRPELFASSQGDQVVQLDTSGVKADLARLQDTQNVLAAMDRARPVLEQTARVLARSVKANLQTAHDRAEVIADSDIKVEDGIKPLKAVYGRGAEARSSDAKKVKAEADKQARIAAKEDRDNAKILKLQDQLAKLQAKKPKP